MSVVPLLSCLLVVSGCGRRPTRLASTGRTLLAIYDVNVTTLFFIVVFASSPRIDITIELIRTGVEPTPVSSRNFHQTVFFLKHGSRILTLHN